MSKKSLSQLFSRWSGRGRTVSADPAARNRVRLRMEEFEHRIVPATLPPVTASDTRVILGGAFAPQAVSDPTNPNLIVVVSATTQTILGQANYGVLLGQITRDGGQTWNSFTIANPDSGFQSGPGRTTLTNINSPSVAFSRTGDLYITWTSTTADQTSGRLRVASFTVAHTAPASGANGVTPLFPPAAPTPAQSESVVLYQWFNQDPAFNPVIAVDNNLDQYTDPDTATTTGQDTMLRADKSGKAVYVAWNTNAVTPTVDNFHNSVPPTTYTPTIILGAASRDRGATWSTPVTISDGGFFPGGPVNQRGGIAPIIKFTPGDLNKKTTDSAGQLQFFWTKPGNPLPTLPQGSFLASDTTTPDDDLDPTTNNLTIETTTNYLSPTGPGTAIQEATVGQNNAPDSPNPTTSKITVNIDSSAASTNGAFFDFLTDLDVTVTLAHPHLNQISVTLNAPNGLGSVPLVLNRIDGFGNTIGSGGSAQRGLADNNDTSGSSGLGVNNFVTGPTGGTVFDNQAARLIHDPANNAAPSSITGGYVAHFRPENNGSLNFGSALVSKLNGDWTLTILDFRDDDRQNGFTPNVPVPFLYSWSMKMSSLIKNGFGVDSIQGVPIPWAVASNANLGGTTATNASANGVAAGYTFAYDLSQGSFSPYSGRLYTAYIGTNGNVLTRYSDDQGASWSFAVRANDDFASDNFSEGSRTHLEPSITVDPVTGTAVLMWYDARWDASVARVSTYMATSIDGGDTWSVQDRTGFLNATKNATDQLNRNSVVLEPLPTNLRAIGAREAGQRQSVIAYGGQIKPFWTGNDNANNGNIYTATVQTAAGPRIIDNDTTLNTDQGAVTIGAATGGAANLGYNNTFAADGTRLITGFTVTFDRGNRGNGHDRGGVDVASFTPADVTVLFLAPGTDRSVPATSIPIAAIVALDPITTASPFSDDATRFYVQFATPQSAVGTYSYAVGPDISVRVRAPDSVNNVNTHLAVFTPPDTPTAIPDLGMTESTLSVPVLDGNPVVQGLQVLVDIAKTSGFATYLPSLKITLFGPDSDGTGPSDALSVVLVNRSGSGNNYTNTRLNDAAIVSIANGTAPYSTGIFKPENPLSKFNGTSLAGNWTLRVEDLEGGTVGTLRSWSITFLDAGGSPITVRQSRAFMDQDGDGRTREIGTNFVDTTPKNQQPPHLYTDAYTAPGSSGRDQFNVEPFAGPVADNTLPLISTGPHLVLVGNPGETAVVSFATRDAANAAVLHVTLDRAVDITTFDASDVVAVVNQAGPISANLTSVVPTNAANEIASQFDFIYQGSTLPTGKYSVSLGTNFLVADGMFRNTTSNQMILRFDRDIDPTSFTPTNVLRITGPIGNIQDVQDITLLGTAGTFTVTFDDGLGSAGLNGSPASVQTTVVLPFNTPASGGTTPGSSLQSALAALTNVGAGNVVITEEALPAGGRVFHIIFTGLLKSSQLPLVATGTGGTTATVQQVGVTVTPVPTTINATNGGARAFFVTYPKQRLSGPYTIEIGQNPFGASIHAVDVPQLVTVQYTTPKVSTVRNGSVGFPEIQTVRILATSGTFRLTFNGSMTAPLAFDATAAQVAAALNVLPSVSAGGGFVVVTASGASGDITYTITFGGVLGSSDLPEIVASFVTIRNDLTVVFNRDIANGEFVLSDILAVTGPSGTVPLNTITGIQRDSARQFRILFGAATLPAGQYVVDFDTTRNLKVANSGPAIDMNFNAGLDTLRGDDPTSTDLSRLAFRSTGPVTIAPATNTAGGVVTESYIVIGEDYTIRQSTLEQIRVLLNISHPDVRDLAIDLVPPDATGVAPIRLFTGRPNATGTSNTSSANFSDTLLVDRVGDPNIPNIESGSPPYLSGGKFYSPQTPLSGLVGKDAKGVWTLRVLNTGKNVQTNDPNFTAGDPIQITNWTLTLPRAITITNQKFDRNSAVTIDPNTTVVTTQPGGNSVSEVQTITVSGAASGSFSVAFNGATTGLLSRTTTSAQLQSALNGLSTIGGVGGSVTVTSSTSANGDQVFTVRFGGTLANTDVPQMTTLVVTTSSLFVPVDFAITETSLSQIQMLVNISHSNVRDLDIDLISPNNVTVRLFTGSTLAPTAANQTANFTNTRLIDRVNDPSAPSIQSAIPPFNAGAAGFFSPQNPLTALVGTSTRGTWTLKVTNHGKNPTTIDPNFKATDPVQITNWSLTFPRLIPTTGLGQPTADRLQAAFRIFTQDPTNTLTQTTWTPVGPAPTNETANSARVSALAVDPTDPSGNTVFVAVAGGGIWKTTDFLNTSSALQNGGLVPRGPSYVPLTDFGPTSAVNVSSIAVFPRNNDPHQTIVLALTGEPATEGKLGGPYTQAGVGVIRSLDGGKTWQVLDSQKNVDKFGNVVLLSDQNTRDHLFVGATGHKIVVDPTPGKDGGVIVYMALSGNANQNGLWRSLNGGNTWTRIQAGNATDVVLSAGSANQTDPALGVTVYQGNLQKLFAAFRSTPVVTGAGVYQTDSAPAAFSLSYMAGNAGLPAAQDNPLIIDDSIPGSPHVTTNVPVSIPNSGRRTLLAVPALSGDPLKDSFLKDWVYAVSADATGAVQLYLTKDAGAHWTRIRVPNTASFFTPPLNGSNNESTVSFNPPSGLSPRAQVNVGSNNDYNMAIAVDPENPYIVFLAGSGTNSIRLDLTKTRDAHNFTFYNNSDVVLGAAATPVSPNPALSPANAADPTFTTQIDAKNQTIGGFQPQIFIPGGQITGTPAHGVTMIGGDPINFYADAAGNPIDFLNLFGGRDYNQPFISNSTIRVENTGNVPQSGLAGFFVNDGADTSWSPFSDILDPNVPDQTGSLRTENRFSAINAHAIVSFTDPVTGKTRLIFGTDDGVFTGVDSGSQVGSGTLLNGIGFSQAVHGNRNGNLQVSQFYSGAVQPSQLAADLAGALFYGMGDQSGFPVSTGNILATGDLNWRGPTGHGASVLVDQAGSGTAFQYRSPNDSGFDLNVTQTNLDFFRVLSNTSDQSFGGGFSRTGNSSGSLFSQGDVWPDTLAYNPLITVPQPNANPVNPNVLMFGSNGGRLYRSTDQGVSWVLTGTPANFDGTAVITNAFGASDPTKPTLTNNFLYAGTNGGRIYSTTTGGAPWGPPIGSTANGLDGSPVIRIIPNPGVGKKDVFALTTSGVFYKADGTDPGGTWLAIKGNLFNLTRTVFGNPIDQDPALKANSLSALAVDWRFAFTQPNDPSATFPILYAAGDGGVFRTVDFGTTWTFFPDVATNNAPADGGYLPNTHITDLDLSIGDLDPTTGRYKAGGLNMLVATTYGRGTFAIRLDPNLQPASFISGPRVTQLINPNAIGGPSSQLNVKFSSPVDPATFTPSDVLLLGPGSHNEVQTVTVVGGTTVNTFTLTFNGQTTNPIPYGSLPSVVRSELNLLPAIGANGVSVISTAVAGGLVYTVTFDGPAVRYANQNPITATGTGPAPTVGTVQDGSPPITVTSVNLISTTDANGLNPRDLFAIKFPTQTGTGSYDITIGYNPVGGDIPLISDTSGFLMNQDNDTANGEAIVDQYRSTIQLNSTTNNHLVVVSSPATAVAGSTYSVTIEARDANDLLLNGVSGALTLTPAPGTGTFTSSPATLTNGVATFTVIYQTAGAETVNVSFTAPPSINATAWTTNVVAGAATQFVITPASSILTAGATQPFTLTTQDAFGNTALTYNQTATITRTGAAATLPASVAVVKGVASFNGTFNASGNVQITATGPDPANPPSGVLTGTANVAITAGTATQLSVSISAGPYSVGTVATVTVRALDSLGNVSNSLDGTTLVRSVSPGTGFTLNPVANPTFVNGVATYTITFTAPGFYTITNTANGPLTAVIGPIGVTATPPPPSPTQNLPGIYGVGSGVAGSSAVTIYNGDGTVKTTFVPFPAGYHNEVDPAGSGFFGGDRVAVGDVTGDGIPDYVVGSGPTITASVVVFNGATGKRVLDYTPFETFKGGVFVAVGDITGDGINDIVITPDEGGGPRVTILRGGDFTRTGNFFGINDPNFRGGARAAIGDINGDGFAELVISAGFGGGPRISIFDGAALAQGNQSHPIGDFFLFEPALRNGAYVAVGDVDGDGFGDLIGGAGPGGGPRILVVSGKKLLESGPDGPQPAIDAPIANFFSGDPNLRGGIRVTAKNIDKDRFAELVTGAGSTDDNGNLGGSTVSVYLGTNLKDKNYTALSQFDLILGYAGGVFVG